MGVLASRLLLREPWGCWPAVCCCANHGGVGKPFAAARTMGVLASRLLLRETAQPLTLYPSMRNGFARYFCTTPSSPGLMFLAPR